MNNSSYEKKLLLGWYLDSKADYQVFKCLILNNSAPKDFVGCQKPIEDVHVDLNFNCIILMIKSRQCDTAAINDQNIL